MSNFKLYIFARTEMQLESLNASGAVGNYTRLQEGYVVVDGEPVPVPVITGNALKNWHARAMAEKYVELTGDKTKIHDIHFAHMFRLPGDVIRNRNLRSEREAEQVLISECAICDLHGLLIAEQNLPQVKRESLIKFSFSVPIEEEVAKRLKFVMTHNRVVPAGEMMIFKREYASAIYAWLSAINLGSLGRSQYDKEPKVGIWLGKKIVGSDEERAYRAKASILAFDSLLTGSLGASTSRALPISKPVEVVAVLVRSCAPIPYHPYYANYKENLTAYLTSYHERIEKVFAMNVKIREALEALSKQSGQRVHEELIKKVSDDFKDHYSLLNKLAEEVYAKIKGEK